MHTYLYEAEQSTRTRRGFDAKTLNDNIAALPPKRQTKR
jgi:hypothetical protein